MIDPFISPREAAEKVGCSIWSVNYWTRLEDQPCPCIRCSNGRVVLVSDEFDKWYSENIDQLTGKLKRKPYRRKVVLGNG